MTEVVLPTERAAPLGRWIVRLVAFVVLLSGVMKVIDVASAESTRTCGTIPPCSSRSA